MPDIEDLAQILQSMLSSDGNSGAGTEPEDIDASGEDVGNLNDGGFGDFFAGFDLDMLMKMSEMLVKFKQSDKNTDLLVALKPHLRPENRDKIDTAIRLVRIMGLLPFIKDMGLMDKIF
ncbi:MAG: hypothetical protein LBR74_03810 [Eubacterium sp.]|jgi:hypothetical protein|nr:hypothetical protein [Eubacterium sp.]